MALVEQGGAETLIESLAKYTDLLEQEGES